jgi:hypothetical protein
MGVLGICATSGPRSEAHPKPSQITYVKDVRPILEKRCAGCHASGTSALALDSYDGARASAGAIRESVLERRMPPWPAAQGFGDFKNDRSLTPIEIEMLVAWADGRTPRGTEADAPAAAVAPPTSPAFSVAVPQGHPARAAAERVDVALAFDREHSIVGWTFEPRDAAIKRAVFSVDGVRLGSWVPSQGPARLPPGIAVAARAGSRLTAEMQYVKSRSASGGGGTLALSFGAAGAPPSHLSLTCGEHRIARSVRAFAITPLAAAAGDSIEVAARLRDGSVVPMSVVPRYQPAYPLTYEFRAPVRLPRGTIVDVRSSAPGCSAGLDVVIDREPGRAR